MDHDLVVRQKMTERYLLDELDPEVRDEFEAHYFDCPECANDVHAGSLFVEQSKTLLAQDALANFENVRTPHARPSWLAWMRPAFVMPVLAVLLAVIGYQNLVTYPALRKTLNSPQALPWASINVGTYGTEVPAVAKLPQEDFLLFVRVPHDDSYTGYTADLYDSAGQLEWSLTIQPDSVPNPWPVRVPGANRKAGNYKLTVRGITAEGKSTEIGRASFELQIQK
jgi:hypothetical protein